MVAPATLEEAWLPGRDGINFYTRTYSVSSPLAVVIFIHGFSEHIGRYEWAHSVFASKGVAVFAYDQRGYGRTALDRAHRSEGSTFGKTSLDDGLLDLEWWLHHLRRQFSGLPIFALGNSMGGALVLSFVTRPFGPSSHDGVPLLSGVICSGTLLYQHQVKSQLLRYIVRNLSTIVPYLVINAPIPSEELTRNPTVQAAVKTDPYALQKGSLKGLTDMLDAGEYIWNKSYQNYPHGLPILLFHGTLDKVTCFDSARQFIEKLDAADKTFVEYPGAYHELFHEPEGVKEKFVDECTSWILQHSTSLLVPAVAEKADLGVCADRADASAMAVTA